MKNELDKLTTVVVSDDDRQLNDILFDLGVAKRSEQKRLWKILPQRFRTLLLDHDSKTGRFFCGLGSFLAAGNPGTEDFFLSVMILPGLGGFMASLFLDAFLTAPIIGFEKTWALFGIIYAPIFALLTLVVMLSMFSAAHSLSFWETSEKKNKIYEACNAIFEKHRNELFDEKNGKLTLAGNKFKRKLEDLDKLIKEFEASITLAEKIKSIRLAELRKGLKYAREVRFTVQSEHQLFLEREAKVREGLDRIEIHVNVIQTDKNIPTLFTRLERYRKDAVNIITESNAEFYAAAVNIAEDLQKLSRLLASTDQYLSSLGIASSLTLDLDESEQKLMAARISGELMEEDASTILTEASVSS